MADETSRRLGDLALRTCHKDHQSGDLTSGALGKLDPFKNSSIVESVDISRYDVSHSTGPDFPIRPDVLCSGV